MLCRSLHRIIALHAFALGGFWALNLASCETRREVTERSSAQPPGTTVSPQVTAVGSASTAASSAPPKESVRQGQELYQKYCALCHGAEAQGYVADNAPSLVTKSFLESASNSFLERAIRDGRSNTAMAAYGRQRGGPLSSEQIHAIVRYLRSLGPKFQPLPPYRGRGDAQRGEPLFRTHCQRCHGDQQTRGNALSLHNPEFLRSVSAAFVKHAIENGRAPAPMPEFRGMLTDAQMDDIVAWLMSTPLQSERPKPAVVSVPDDLPLIINPKGAPPSFKLRDDLYVSAVQVKDALQQKRRLIVIDARSGADWIQFHIPGSVPIGYYETEKLSRVPNDGTWVVAYCACPHHASGEIVSALRKRGYKHTAILDEGILEWKRRDYPLEGAAVEGRGDHKP